MRLFVVVRNINKKTDGLVDDWEVCGVFSDEEKAISVCRDESCFIGPINLDEVLPEETVSWPGCYYPKARQE